MTRERFEQILFAHVSDEVVQDMLNEYVLELESSNDRLRELVDALANENYKLREMLGKGNEELAKMGRVIEYLRFFVKARGVDAEDMCERGVEVNE